MLTRTFPSLITANREQLSHFLVKSEVAADLKPHLRGLPERALEGVLNYNTSAAITLKPGAQWLFLCFILIFFDMTCVRRACPSMRSNVVWIYCVFKVPKHKLTRPCEQPLALFDPVL